MNDAAMECVAHSIKVKREQKMFGEMFEFMEERADFRSG